MVGCALQSLLISFLDQLSSDQIDGIFFSLLTRIHSGRVDDKCQRVLVQCLTIIAFHCVTLLDRWQDFGDSISLLFFVSIFEGKDRLASLMREVPPYKFCELAQGPAIQVLATVTTLSSDWLDLCRMIVPYFEPFTPLYQFSDRFPEILRHPDLYSSFFDVLDCLLIPAPDWLSEEDRDFLQPLMAVALDIAVVDVGLCPLIFDMLFDFDPEGFWKERLPFTRHALEQFSRCVPGLVSQPEESIGLLKSSVSECLGIWRDQVDLWPCFFPLLGNLVELLELQAVPPLAFLEIFENITIPIEDGQFCAPLLEFFGQMVASPNNGVLSAVACASEGIRAVFAFRLFDFALSAARPPDALFFLRRCAATVVNHPSASSLFRVILFYISKAFEKSEIQYDAVLTLAIFAGPPVIAEWIERNLFQFLMTALQVAVPPPVLVILIRSLWGLIPDDNADAIVLINQTINSTIAQAAAAQGLGAVFAFMNGLVRSCDSDQVDHEFSVYLHRRYVHQVRHLLELTADLWRLANPQVLSLLCEFVGFALEKRLLRRDEVRFVLQRISERVADTPIPEAFALLSGHVADFHDVLEAELPAFAQLIEFVAHAHELPASELALEVLKFIRELLFRRFEPFFECFPLDVIVLPILSEDWRMGEIAITSLHLIVGEGVQIPEPEALVNALLRALLLKVDGAGVKQVVEVIARMITMRAVGGELVAHLLAGNLGEVGQGQAEAFLGALAGAISGEGSMEEASFRARKMAAQFRRSQQN